MVKLNVNKIEVISNVRKSLPNPFISQKSIVGSDKLVASYIARFLEDIEQGRNITLDNNEPNSSVPKIDASGVVHPSLAPLPDTNFGNYLYGMPLYFFIGQTSQFQPPRPTMATPVRPM